MVLSLICTPLKKIWDTWNVSKKLYFLFLRLWLRAQNNVVLMQMGRLPPSNVFSDSSFGFYVCYAQISELSVSSLVFFFLNIWQHCCSLKSQYPLIMWELWIRNHGLKFKMGICLAFSMAGILLHAQFRQSSKTYGLDFGSVSEFLVSAYTSLTNHVCILILSQKLFKKMTVLLGFAW